MATKINLSTLRQAARDLDIATDLIDQSNTIDSLLDSTAVVSLLNHLLFEVHLVEGFLVCPDSGRKFPVKDGIPNMLLHEDEV